MSVSSKTTISNKIRNDYNNVKMKMCAQFLQTERHFCRILSATVGS